MMLLGYRLNCIPSKLKYQSCSSSLSLFQIIHQCWLYLGKPLSRGDKPKMRLMAWTLSLPSNRNDVCIIRGNLDQLGVGSCRGLLALSPCSNDYWLISYFCAILIIIHHKNHLWKSWLILAHNSPGFRYGLIEWHCLWQTKSVVEAVHVMPGKEEVTSTGSITRPNFLSFSFFPLTFPWQYCIWCFGIPKAIWSQRLTLVTCCNQLKPYYLFFASVSCSWEMQPTEKKLNLPLVSGPYVRSEWGAHGSGVVRHWFLNIMAD